MMCSFIQYIFPKKTKKDFYTDHSLCFPAPNNLMAKNRVSTDKTKSRELKLDNAKIIQSLD